MVREHFYLDGNHGDVKRKVALAKEDVAKMHEENNQKLKEFCEKIPCGSD